MKVICIRKCKFQTFTIEPGEWLEVYQESSDYHYQKTMERTTIK